MTVMSEEQVVWLSHETVRGQPHALCLKWEGTGCRLFFYDGTYEPTSMLLTEEEIEAFVREWRGEMLSPSEVLFSCGCTVNWKEYQEDFVVDPEPREGIQVFCGSHGEGYKAVQIVRVQRGTGEYL